MTARAEISRLLAIFNDLTEKDKDLVLKISESVTKPEIVSSFPPQNEDLTIPNGIGGVPFPF
ncbi:hypothetical protein AGMMS49991_08470 [Spirochaetia bacterium]|nr:hypothetical protein AGMMS49991_08470 [Spirochaetia bacterium]